MSVISLSTSGSLMQTITVRVAYISEHSLVFHELIVIPHDSNDTCNTHNLSSTVGLCFSSALVAECSRHHGFDLRKQHRIYSISS